MVDFEIVYVLKGETHRQTFTSKDAAVDWIVGMYRDEPSFAVVSMALHREGRINA